MSTILNHADREHFHHWRKFYCTALVYRWWIQTWRPRSFQALFVRQLEFYLPQKVARGVGADEQWSSKVLRCVIPLDWRSWVEPETMTYGQAYFLSHWSPGAAPLLLGPVTGVTDNSQDSEAKWEPWQEFVADPQFQSVQGTQIRVSCNPLLLLSAQGQPALLLVTTTLFSLRNTLLSFSTCGCVRLQSWAWDPGLTNQSHVNRPKGRCVSPARSRRVSLRFLWELWGNRPSPYTRLLNR